MIKIEINLTGKQLADCIAFLDQYLCENSGIIGYNSLKALVEELEK